MKAKHIPRIEEAREIPTDIALKKLWMIQNIKVNITNQCQCCLQALNKSQRWTYILPNAKSITLNVTNLTHMVNFFKKTDLPFLYKRKLIVSIESDVLE